MSLWLQSSVDKLGTLEQAHQYFEEHDFVVETKQAKDLLPTDRLLTQFRNPEEDYWGYVHLSNLEWCDCQKHLNSYRPFLDANNDTVVELFSKFKAIKDLQNTAKDVMLPNLKHVYGCLPSPTSNMEFKKVQDLHLKGIYYDSHEGDTNMLYFDVDEIVFVIPDDNRYIGSDGFENSRELVRWSIDTYSDMEHYTTEWTEDDFIRDEIRQWTFDKHLNRCNQTYYHGDTKVECNGIVDTYVSMDYIKVLADKLRPYLKIYMDMVNAYLNVHYYGYKWDDNEIWGEDINSSPFGNHMKSITNSNVHHAVYMVGLIPKKIEQENQMQTKIPEMVLHATLERLGYWYDRIDADKPYNHVSDALKDWFLLE